MKSNLLPILIFLMAAFCAHAQTSETGASTNAKAKTPNVAAAEEAVPEDGSKSKVGKAAPAQVPNGYVRPDSKTRFRRYVKSIVGPGALARTVVSAGFSTWRNSPEEWGDNWEGFGRRVASSFGKSVIKNTTMYGLDETLRYDSRFYRSKNKDFGSRLGNALISPVTARNENGKRVIGIPRLAGTYTSAIVAAETWYPSRFDYKDGLRSGTISLGIGTAFNVFKEFVWKK